MKLVTVCVTGAPPRTPRQNRRRLTLLADLMDEIDARWRGVDAVVFPGGYFALGSRACCFDRRRRRPVLQDHGLTDPLHDARCRLSRSRGAWLVVGIDRRPSPSLAADQLVTAYGPRRALRIARKITPGASETGYVANAADFDAGARTIHLACGHRAILAACYDMFGVADAAAGNLRMRGLRLVARERDRQPDESRPAHQTCLERLAATLHDVRPTVGLAAIHGFPADAFQAPHAGVALWQRHGIAACAAALGGVAVGAAHFRTQLPRSASVSCLAAGDVPDSHLRLADRTRRQGWSWEPEDHFRRSPALVRLYQELKGLRGLGVGER